MTKPKKGFNVKLPLPFNYNEEAPEVIENIVETPQVVEQINNSSNIQKEDKEESFDVILEIPQQENKTSKGISQKALSAGLDNPSNKDEEGKLTIKNLREIALIKEKNEKITYNVTYYKEDLDSLKLIKDITKIPIQQLFRDILTLGVKQLSENVKTSEEYREFQKRIKLL